MKKLMLSFLCLVVGFQCVAQDYPKNEISANYGYVSIPYAAVTFAGVFGSVITSIASGGEVVAESIKSSGPLGIQYYRNINSHVGLGAEFIYERSSVTFTNQDPSILNFITIMPSFKCRWFQNRTFGMYSRASVGVCATAIPISQWLPADDPIQSGLGFHVVPVGMAFGSKDLKFVAELGGGMGPLVSVGAVYGF